MELQCRHSNCGLILRITLVTVTRPSVVDRAAEGSQEGLVSKASLSEFLEKLLPPLGLHPFIS